MIFQFVLIVCLFVDVTKTSTLLPVPDFFKVKTAGHFENVVPSAASGIDVPIRFCGNALLVPSWERPKYKSTLKRCPAEPGSGFLSRMFDRWLDRIFGSPPMNQVRWGEATPSKKYNRYGQQSGLGFVGIAGSKNVPTNGTEFLVGSLIHFNHAVYGWIETASLHLNISINGYYTNVQVPLRIHETPNDEDACPYASDRQAGCADRVWLTPRHALLPPSLRAYRHVQRVAGVARLSDELWLSVRGVRSHPNALGEPTAHDFVSQERRDTYAYLYAAFLPKDQLRK